MTKVKDLILYDIGFLLILIGNVCFYSMDAINTYIVVATLGALFILIPATLRSHLVFKIEPCFLWLTVIYTLFTINGTLRLQQGIYNWDFILFTYVQNLALYICFKKFLSSMDAQRVMIRSIIIATTFILVYLVVVERENLIVGGIRIGDMLSGNVNTTGVNLGILSVFIAYALNQRNTKKICWIVFVATIALMLLSGSKKTLIYLAMDLLIFFFYARGNKKIAVFLGVIIAGIVLLYVILNVPTFYNVLGYRIEDMLFQLIGSKRGHYSHSTDAREGMILEGFRIFLNHPIFGGGEKYFATLTKFGYDYSHCNYIEMLCNFGLVGTLLFYFPYFQGLSRIRTRDFALKTVIILLLVASLITHWMMVVYSSICIDYIPIILCYAALQTERQTEVYGLNKRRICYV